LKGHLKKHARVSPLLRHTRSRRRRSCLRTASERTWRERKRSEGRKDRISRSRQGIAIFSSSGPKNCSAPTFTHEGILHLAASIKRSHPTPFLMSPGGRGSLRAAERGERGRKTGKEDTLFSRSVTESGSGRSGEVSARVASQEGLNESPFRLSSRLDPVKWLLVSTPIPFP
jgi:hypothetical protein